MININQYIQAFEQKDLATLAMLFSKDMSFQDPTFGLIQGRENVINVYKEIFKNTILSSKILRQWQKNNLYFLEFALLLKDIEGKKIVIEGIDLIETSPTHITSIRAYLDVSDYVQRKLNLNTYV